MQASDLSSRGRSGEQGEAERGASRLSPAELQFGLALRMLKAATDNMQVAFDALIRARSPSTPDNASASGAGDMSIPGRPVFGERAARALEAAERLRQQETQATGSDAAPSSTIDEPSTQRADNGTGQQPA